MKLAFGATRMLLANVNVRGEVHGEEREPAADLKLEVDVSNDFLATFHPALRSLLYHWDEAIQHDLADEGKRAAGFAPDLRMDKLVLPLKWDDEMAGAKVSIGLPGVAPIVLEPAKVNAFAIEPRQGGTVSLAFRVQAHPNEASFGKLCSLVQQEVEVSVSAPEEAPAKK